MIAQVGHAAALHDAAFIEQDDLIREIGGFSHVVRDQNGRLFQSREDLLEVSLQC